MYTRLAQLYNSELISQAEQSIVRVIDFIGKITRGKGQILDHYKADFIHCNAKVGDLVADMLGEKNETDYQWYYKYSFKADDRFSFKIWGDFDKKDLI